MNQSGQADVACRRILPPRCESLHDTLAGPVRLEEYLEIASLPRQLPLHQRMPVNGIVQQFVRHIAPLSLLNVHIHGIPSKRSRIHDPLAVVVQQELVQERACELRASPCERTSMAICLPSSAFSARVQ